MDNTQTKFQLRVYVEISNAQYAGGGVQIREDVPIKPVDFRQMAEILEAFHVIVQKYRA